ncbi:hypothetical protein P5673_006113 [Acropora cervicornis]|uniref:Uncharacterized protein n=1 Tax=Acropora cervicornis TaxID=6130 RepID=A0AAD9QXR7_ACRCE|nr:hypothetical protein P5673_006113 [Acropora cervicornis]
MANLEEENKQLERNLVEAQEQLEKGKEKSDALDKENKELQVSNVLILKLQC